jgi:hypothetical protein
MFKKHFPHFLMPLIALLGYCVNLKAQQIPVPDCIVPFDTGAGAGAGTYNFPGGNGFDNRTVGCVTWTLEWQSSLSPTVTFQSSLGVAGPASYGAYTGTTVFSGAGIQTFSNLQTGTVVDTPWVRVDVVTGSSGQTKGVLFGYRTGYTGGTGGGGGGGGGSGCSSPCPVVGTAAAGSPPSGDPVQVGGTDGTDIRAVKTDSSGDVEVLGQGTAAPGASAGNPVMTGTRDDSNNAVADHSFPGQADISGSAVSAIKVVAGSSGKLIYVGHLSVSLAAGTTVSIVEGTTSSTPCDTSATTLAGPYQNTVALALDFTRDDPLIAASGDDLCLSFGGSSTGGGFVKYSQR